MPTTFDEVEQQARSLSLDERARLTEVLLETLSDESLKNIQAAWQREIEERVAAYDRGEVKTYSAEDVFAEASRIYR
ncbi:MAG: addiction module protein [Deltaproteobacteria bacterium]|nr:addiction module protein [Deltaproteobacteria bacterium]